MNIYLLARVKIYDPREELNHFKIWEIFPEMHADEMHELCDRHHKVSPARLMTFYKSIADRGL